MKHDYAIMSKQYTKSLEHVKVVRVGKLLFLSRETPFDKKTGEMITDDFKRAATLCLENLFAEIKEEGTSVENIVSTTVYLKSQECINKFEEIYNLYFGEKAPVKKVVEGKLNGNVPIEMDAVAIVR